MKRLATSLGILIALTAIAPAAHANSYDFAFRGRRFHVEAPRNCRSASCVSISSTRGIQPSQGVDTTPVSPPAPVPVAATPQPNCPPAPIRPPQATVVPQPAPPPAPVLAATASRPATLSPTPSLAPPHIDPPQTISLDPPRIAPAPVAISPPSADEPADSPLGQWESAGAKSAVRIERCGPALCGYALTEASTKGESVLVNMMPKSDGVWAGNIYSRASGHTYYATMRLKASGKLHVEACALGHFWCTGNDWTRVEEGREPVITRSRQWSARS
ncbi:DUF2147 domain-containing protein [Bradyrhizobium commune]|uniref:DUF2147 domain-containing protein n=1 Tax=Bradyrhizobium commune TaxID=83627 RepID=A0A7S9D8Y0_9BRAD|nr:DUF2147 domain-containing protein [Bradyrhizobium commune]QPF93356.1 DUF2147 domain-containing protein [Bradyrhizobium commune]